MKNEKKKGKKWQHELGGGICAGDLFREGGTRGVIRLSA